MPMTVFILINLLLFVLSVSGLSPLVLYPMGVMVLSWFPGRKETGRWDKQPLVTLVVAVRNGERLIEKKIINSLNLDYPEGKLDLLFFSDGSTDETEAIIKRYTNRRIRLFAEKAHQGKNHALNAVMGHTRGEIIVFSDADALLVPDALKKLVLHFGDASVGGVCGQRGIAKESASLKEAQNGYIRMDSFIKRLESRIAGITTNDGKLYAIRKELFYPIAEGVTDDFFVALTVRRQGKRFVFEPEAKAEICLPSRSPVHEIERRRRIVTGSLRCLLIHRELLNPFRHGFFSLGLLANKVFRRGMPFFLIIIFTTTFFLSSLSTVFTLFFLLQTGCYLVSFCHPLLWRCPKVPEGLNKISSTGFYFCIANLGTLLGVVDFLLGRKITRWEPVKEDKQRTGVEEPHLNKGVRTLVVDLSTRFGGASARALGLLKAFPGGETALAGLEESPVTIQARALGIEVHLVGTRKTDPALLFKLMKTIKTHGFHLLDPQNIQSKFWCTLAAMGTGAALVSTLNSWYESELKGSFKGRFYQCLETMTAKGTDLYIVVSRDIRKRLLQKGIPENRIAYIPNAVSLDLPLKSDTRRWLRKKYHLPDQAFVCCAVGRLVEAKGLHHLINAFSRLSSPGICCLIVGDGHLRPALLSQIRTAGLDHRVRLAGHQDRKTVLDLVNASDLFVMPSLSEGTPLALLEAAALCRPIIASRVGGIPEMLAHKTHALLIPPGDEQRLARAIRHLHDHPQQAETLARNACQHVTGHFGIKNQVRSTRNAYLKASRIMRDKKPSG